ncbi:MAG TPA: CHASE2 domain-containing protein [Candidatus Brocadiaceae bacterium]
MCKAVIIGLLTGLLGIAISFIPFVSRFEENTDLDLLFKLRGVRQPPPEVVIIDIDKHSTDALNLPDDPEKWPRSFHASLTEKLTKLGASLIVFDVFFNEPSSAEDDNLFAKVINNTSNVVLCESIRKKAIPFASEKGSTNGNVYIESLVQPISLFAQSALASAPFPLPKVPAKVSQYWTFKTSCGDMPTLPVVAFQIFALTQYNKFLQLLEKFDPSEIDKLPHSKDEIIRSKKVVKIINILRELFKKNPTLAGKMIEELEKPQPLSVDEERILKSLIKIYQGSDSRYLNFYGPPSAIDTIPYYQVLQLSERPDIKRKPIQFDGKVVFVGSTGNLSLQKDGFYTVFSQSSGFDLSGVEIAATAFANLLEDMPIQSLHLYNYLVVIFLWGLAIGAFCRILPLIISAVSVIGISAVYLIITFHQFKTTGIWYPLVIPLFFQAPLAFLGSTVCKYISTDRERKNIRTAFKYYVPDEIASQLSKNITGLKTHNQLVYGTCLSTDAENYTSLSEAMNLKELRSLMNKYYEAISGPIKQHGGIVTNIVGDSALAIWVTTPPDETRRKQACISALEIEREVHRFNQSFSLFMPLLTRIGLHSGQVLLGNVGAIDHYEYSLVGDIVNTTTRIEGLNKYLGTRILASEEVITQLDDFSIRELGKFLLVGKSKPLVLYELLCLKEESNQQQRDLCLFFLEALDAFKRQSWYEAMGKFYKLIRTYGEDGPSQFFLTLCKEYREKKFDESWDGIIRMDKK